MICVGIPVPRVDDAERHEVADQPLCADFRSSASRASIVAFSKARTVA
jgi:hypothetical protein